MELSSLSPQDRDRLNILRAQLWDYLGNRLPHPAAANLIEPTVMKSLRDLLRSKLWDLYKQGRFEGANFIEPTVMKSLRDLLCSKLLDLHKQGLFEEANFIEPTVMKSPRSKLWDLYKQGLFEEANYKLHFAWCWQHYKTDRECLLETMSKTLRGVLSKNDVESVIGSAFMKMASRSCKGTLHLSSVKGWLWRVVNNECIDLLRKKNLKRELLVDHQVKLEQMMQQEISEEDTEERILSESEESLLLEAVEEMLNSIAPQGSDRRYAYDIRRATEWPWPTDKPWPAKFPSAWKERKKPPVLREIAEALEKPLSTVKSQILRISQKIQKTLEKPCLIDQYNPNPSTRRLCIAFDFTSPHQCLKIDTAITKEQLKDRFDWRKKNGEFKGIGSNKFDAFFAFVQHVKELELIRLVEELISQETESTRRLCIAFDFTSPHQCLKIDTAITEEQLRNRFTQQKKNGEFQSIGPSEFNAFLAFVRHVKELIPQRI